jgi:hypothetical protein
MTRLIVALCGCVCMAPIVAVAPAKAASLLNTWVGSNGLDGGGCGSPSSPCATFQGAYNNTSAGGEISCLDSGFYGGVAISKSIKINCENAIGNNAVSAGAGPITIGTTGTDVVILRGLDVDSFGTGTCGDISFTGAGVLYLQKITINNEPGECAGIGFTPNGAAKLFISDSDITNNGASSLAGGIDIGPASGVTAVVAIDHTRIESNYNARSAIASWRATPRTALLRSARDRMLCWCSIKQK